MTAEILHPINRRLFLRGCGVGLGGLALAHLLHEGGVRAAEAKAVRGVLDRPHFPPKAKRIIYLFMAGGPSQLDLFDYKPLLNKMNGEDLPDSVRKGQRLTGMSASQAHLPLAGSIFKFAQHGESRAWVSDLLPNTAKMADDLCLVRSCHTEAINHDP